MGHDMLTVHRFGYKVGGWAVSASHKQFGKKTNKQTRQLINKESNYSINCRLIGYESYNIHIYTLITKEDRVI